MAHCQLRWHVHTLLQCALRETVCGNKRLHNGQSGRTERFADPLRLIAALLQPVGRDINVVDVAARAGVSGWRLLASDQ